MTVLAVLAHELGHVRWYDWVEPVPGLNHPSNYDLSLLMKCVPDGSFFQGSWHAVAAYPNEAFAAPRWLAFGDTGESRLVMHASRPADR